MSQRMPNRERPKSALGEAPPSLLERAVRAFESGALGQPNAGKNAGPGADNLAATMPRPADMLMPPRMDLAGPMARAPAVPPPPAPPIAPPLPARRAAAPTRTPGFRGGLYRIDRGRLQAAGLIVPESGITAQLEEFRLIKRQLLQQAEQMRRQGGGGAAQRVLVTSPLSGEGKSFCAANLALSIAAERDSEVVLVDFDAAKNTVLNTLGLPNRPGLIDALADPRVDVLDCVMTTDIPGLSVLPGGHSTSSDNEYLAAARTPEVLDRLTEGAPNRIVLFDSPPTLAASLPVELAKLVGQVALVVMADRTSQGAIEDAVSLLSGCPNIQLLLNAVQFSPSGRRFGSYYK